MNTNLAISCVTSITVVFVGACLTQIWPRESGATVLESAPVPARSALSEPPRKFWKTNFLPTHPLYNRRTGQLVGKVRAVQKARIFPDGQIDAAVLVEFPDGSTSWKTDTFSQQSWNIVP